MKYYLPAKELFLEIDDRLLQDMHKRALDAYPNEVGGMLAGVYIGKDHAIVKHIVMPQKASSTARSFTRDPAGLEEVWNKLHLDGLEYLGEWHTHPNGTAKYSHTDLDAMKEITNEVHVSILNPILLILSLSATMVRDCNVYLFDASHLLRFQELACEI